MTDEPPADSARRVTWHGMVLVVAGLVMGTVVQQLRNPRLGLSAHVGTLMNGGLVVALGAVWPRLAVGAGGEVAARWLVVVGSYVSCAALFAAAALGTHTGTPMAGAGYTADPVAETLVGAGLVGGGIALLAGCALVLHALRRRP